MKKEDLPKKIAIFPLSNFIIFPRTTVPLNIFEPRYIDMVNDCMKSGKLIGMIQPKNKQNENENIPDLYEIGCMGKITSFKETEDKRFLIELKVPPELIISILYFLNVLSNEVKFSLSETETKAFLIFNFIAKFSF